MTYTQFADGIVGMDIFFKNVGLLFKDMQRIAADRAGRQPLINVMSDGGSWFGSDSSQAVFGWIFEHNEQLRFAQLLLKTSDEWLRNPAWITNFMPMCAHLDRDPRAPLLLTYGILRPTEGVAWFKAQNNLQQRRHWLINTCLIDLNENQQLVPHDPGGIAFNQPVEIAGNNVPAWYCQGARFVISDLLAIQNTQDLDAWVDNLLAM